MSTTLIKKRHALEQAHLTVHSKLLLQERLAHLLSSIQPGSLSIQNNHTLTFTTQDLLDPDPAYSGTLPARLFLKNNTLILTIKDRPEILAENIHALHLQLIAPGTLYTSLRLTITPTLEPPFLLAFFCNKTDTARISSH